MILGVRDIKNRINELHKEWDATDDDIDGMKESDSIESDIFGLIRDYCEANHYMVKGFPFEKRKVFNEEEAEEYFTDERYKRYVDELAMTHDDVTELLWHYYHTFWPNDELWGDKERFVRLIQIDPIF
jgi:hypothetical protein